MKSLLIAALFAVVLMPTYQSLSQEVTDSDSTISVITTNDAPYVYQNPDGHTVVIGEVENRNSLTAMSGVVVGATFLDELGNVLDSAQGTTVLDVIPPNSISPYVVTSKITDPNIKLVSVDVQAFNSSPTKDMGLELAVSGISYGEEEEEGLVFSGTVTNTGNVPSSDTLVHLAFYDVFQPPRMLHIESTSAGDVPIGETAEFAFSVTPNPKAVGFAMFSESDILQSGPVDVKLPRQEILTQLITISSLSITGPDGKNISNIPVGSAVDISSNLAFQTIAGDRIQPYVYYVQIKQSGTTPYVEFIGASDGIFHGSTAESASVRWTPERPGLYFVETFGWDQNAVPIASKGPVSIVMAS